MTFQGFLEETQSCLFIPLFRDIAFQDRAFVIDGAPQAMCLTIDLHENLIHVPTPLPVAPHPADALSFDVGRKHRAKPVPPQPHGFMTQVVTRSNSRSSTFRSDSG